VTRSAGEVRGVVVVSQIGLTFVDFFPPKMRWACANNNRIHFFDFYFSIMFRNSFERNKYLVKKRKSTVNLRLCSFGALLMLIFFTMIKMMCITTFLSIKFHLATVPQDKRAQRKSI
jgi:hypothetical protein